MDSVHELVNMYLAKTGKVNPWFTRRMKQTTPEIRDQVWREIRNKGLDQPEAKPAVRPDKPDLTEEDWTHLAELVFTSMRNHPTASLVKLANRAMAQLPKDRQKRITGVNIRPLLQKINAKLQQMSVAAEENELLRLQLEETEKAPSKEEVLSALDDEEILKQFGAKVLSLTEPHHLLNMVPVDVTLENIPMPVLVGRAVQRVLETYEASNQALVKALESLRPQPHQNNGSPPKAPSATQQLLGIQPRQIPRVTLMGLMQVQFDEVESQLKHLARFHYFDKDKHVEIPTSDYIVLWTRHVKHMHQIQAQQRASSMSGCELVWHTGGVKTLVKKLQGILCR